MNIRTEFGYPRTTCNCRDCQMNCRVMPGYLIPADLTRMIPAGADPFRWAEDNLLASPGAKMMNPDTGATYRIHTLVPATKPDGSCINLYGGRRNGKCAIHENAPFGCAFFDCGPEVAGLSERGLYSIKIDGESGLYARIWNHLDALGKRQLSPDILRERFKTTKR